MITIEPLGQPTGQATPRSGYRWNVMKYQQGWNPPGACAVPPQGAGLRVGTRQFYQPRYQAEPAAEIGQMAWRRRTYRRPTKPAKRTVYRRRVVRRPTTPTPRRVPAKPPPPKIVKTEYVRPKKKLYTVPHARMLAGHAMNFALKANRGALARYGNKDPLKPAREGRIGPLFNTIITFARQWISRASLYTYKGKRYRIDDPETKADAIEELDGMLRAFGYRPERIPPAAQYVTMEMRKPAEPKPEEPMPTAAELAKQAVTYAIRTRYGRYIRGAAQNWIKGKITQRTPEGRRTTTEAMSLVGRIVDDLPSRL